MSRRLSLTGYVHCDVDAIHVADFDTAAALGEYLQSLVENRTKAV